MVQAGSNAEIIEVRLRAGEEAGALVREGFPNSTVYRVRSKLLGKGAQGNGKKKAPASADQMPAASGGVRVRITQEEMTLPGGMFILYDMVKARFPQYAATKSQWLEDVVQTWAQDHAEELGFNFIFPDTQGQTEDSNGGSDDAGSMEAVGAPVRISDFSPRTGDVLGDPGPDGPNEDG